MRVAFLISIVAIAAASAQELTPTATPTSVQRSVTLRFVPPPLSGTISLGIYNHAGKLVRVLHREDALSDFTAGADALETTWDGAGDDGVALPSGKYSARGYVVGDLGIEGVGYFFNDWVTTDNSPRILDARELWSSTNELHMLAALAGGEVKDLVLNRTSGAIERETADPGPANHCTKQWPKSEPASVVDCAGGRGGTIWLIGLTPENALREVRQLAPDGALLRRLSYAASDPQPQRIEASQSEERIFLIEKNEQLQRLRGLTLVRAASGAGDELVSDWKTDFEKRIVAHKDFVIENGQPVTGAGHAGQTPEALRQKLRPNPLKLDQTDELQIAVGFDTDGSYLKSVDGLPLRTISDTRSLCRIVLERRDDTTISIFQDDGAVVEQFRASHLDQIVAFDCGEFELK